jgi:hypothetical protein
MRFPAATLFLLFASTVLFAQTQAPAPPPQTAREALVEMITGGEKGLAKHLTVEVQDLLNKRENKQGAAMLGMFNVMQQQSGADMQSFPAGSTLFTVNEPAQHKKLEVHVDSDDLSGDQDILQLSLHSLRDGQEQPDEQDEWGFMSSRITVTMKKQQNIWRLSDIGVGIDLPLGDPEFLKKTFLKAAGGAATGSGATAPGFYTELKPEKPQAFDPSGMVAMLGFAERTFANQHPDIGFTCSLPELAEAGKAFGLDAQLASGSYMGYKWSLSGCEGKPAGSFQIVAEPIAQGRGAKAVCTDATQNLRAMEDGRGSTCFTAGKVNVIAEESGENDGMVGGKIVITSDQPKP